MLGLGLDVSPPLLQLPVEQLAAQKQWPAALVVPPLVRRCGRGWEDTRERSGLGKEGRGEGGGKGGEKAGMKQEGGGQEAEWEGAGPA